VGKTFGPKPLVDVNLTTEFGEIHEADVFNADGVSRHDYTYVPGWSEMSVDRQLALAKLYRREIKAGEVPLLPVNLHWFRTVKGAGSDPDQMKVAHAKNLGYRAVTKDDIGKHAWITGMPPGAVVAPDGTIKTAAGDNVLMVADQRTAAKNAMRKKILTEQMVDGIQYSKDGLGEVGGKARGADPQITKETQ
jgi:hypothetical protein